MMLRRLALCAVFCCAARVGAQQPIEVKVVVVTMFELGADDGDRPGEMQFWVEREKLNRVFEFPQGGRNLRMNDDGVLIISTGVGTAKAAASIMALGLDPRFDLRKAYWVVAGIAGVDPNDAAAGSAAWANYVVDGDLAHEIDAREIPADWPTGFLPLRKTTPYETPLDDDVSGKVFRLDSSLVAWAYELTKDIPLLDDEKMQAHRARYASHAGVRQAPHVMIGDVLSSSTYWHGAKLSAWANDWVKYYTNGRGNYVMTAMEDSGTLQALEWLNAAGRVDWRRVLVLRTGSNFDQQRDGSTPAVSFKEIRTEGYPAFLPALEAAYRVGSAVVRELVRAGGPAFPL